MQGIVTVTVVLEPDTIAALAVVSIGMDAAGVVCTPALVVKMGSVCVCVVYSVVSVPSGQTSM